jgi:uncharacterized protein (TIRG00374 family)
MYVFVSGTDWAEVWNSIKRAHVGWLMASFLATWLSMLVRGVRWRILLTGLKPIGIGRLYNAQMIGLMVNGILPARAGEVARCVLLARRERTSVVGVFASVLAERLLDLFMVGLLVVLSINLFEFTEQQTIHLPGADRPIAVDAVLSQAGLYLGWLFAGVVVAISIMLFMPRTDDLVRAILGSGRYHLAEVVLGWLTSIRQGLEVFRRPFRAALALFWTVGVWVLILLSIHLMLTAFGLDIGLLGAMLLTAGLAVSVALPQAPGFLGVYQLAVTLILVACFDTPEATAKAVAIVLWVVNLFGLICLGFVSLAIEGIGIVEILRSRDRVEAEQ